MDLTVLPPQKISVTNLLQADQRGAQIERATLLTQTPAPSTAPPPLSVGSQDLGESINKGAVTYAPTVNQNVNQIESAPPTTQTPATSSAFPSVSFGSQDLGESINKGNTTYAPVVNQTLNQTNITEVSAGPKLVIDEHLLTGGTGGLLAYKARLGDLDLVAKELPRSFTERGGLESFIRTGVRMPRAALSRDGGVASYVGVSSLNETNYLLRNYCPGRPVTDLLTHRPLLDKDVLRILQEVSRLLTAGGEVQHGAISPSNVFVDGPNVRLADVGIQSIKDFVFTRSAGQSGSTGLPWIELVSNIRRHQLSPAVLDVASLACLGFFALSGSSFGTDLSDVGQQHQKAYGNDPSERLIDVCKQGLRGNFSTMVQFNTALTGVGVERGQPKNDTHGIPRALRQGSRLGRTDF